MAAQSAVLSMQAESSLVDVAPASLIRVPINKDTGQPRPRCPCVARHRTSWLAGNSQWSPQWPVRPSLLNPILSDKGGRSPYCSALATRPRQLALRTRRKNVSILAQSRNLGKVFDGSRSPVFGWLLRLGVSNFFFQSFLPTGFGVSDLSFFLSVWSSGVEFLRVHESSCRYSLSNWVSRLRK